jgi:hypothetical protein
LIRPSGGHEATGAWLELSVEADVEAVEAVSEILGRIALGGTSSSQVRLTNRGLAASIRRGLRSSARTSPHGTRPSWNGRSRPRARRSATCRPLGFDPLASSGRGAWMRPTGPRRGRRISRCSGSAVASSCARPGAVTAIQTTSVARSGWPLGPVSTRRATLSRGDRASPIEASGRARGLDVRCGSGFSPCAATWRRGASGRPTRSPSSRRCVYCETGSPTGSGAGRRSGLASRRSNTSVAHRGCWSRSPHSSRRLRRWTPARIRHLHRSRGRGGIRGSRPSRRSLVGGTRWRSSGRQLVSRVIVRCRPICSAAPHRARGGPTSHRSARSPSRAARRGVDEWRGPCLL